MLLSLTASPPCSSSRTAPPGWNSGSAPPSLLFYRSTGAADPPLVSLSSPSLGSPATSTTASFLSCETSRRFVLLDPVAPGDRASERPSAPSQSALQSLTSSGSIQQPRQIRRLKPLPRLLVPGSVRPCSFPAGSGVIRRKEPRHGDLLLPIAMDAIVSVLQKRAVSPAPSPVTDSAAHVGCNRGSASSSEAERPLPTGPGPM
ncbi:uncharacterized protein LOC119297216 isoform X1 [Triticum dicoccoides]|uniref:uncharacterized protein LOC119297216 isoform X1 n=1 Tax=Triticum dicoccoides TaxID=85692 RepID=UPI00188E81A7|nr:uncharacterized protein LOC119297216 isoform X1 [Triticum dicoccoides]